MKNCKDISFSSSLNLKRQTKQTQKNMNISTNMSTNIDYSVQFSEVVNPQQGNWWWWKH